MENEINMVYLKGTYFIVNRERQQLEQFGNPGNFIHVDQMTPSYGAYGFFYDPVAQHIRDEVDNPDNWTILPQKAMEEPFSVNEEFIRNFVRNNYWELDTSSWTDQSEEKISNELKFILDPLFSGKDEHFILKERVLPEVFIGLDLFQVDRLNEHFIPVDRLTQPIPFYKAAYNAKIKKFCMYYNLKTRQPHNVKGADLWDWPKDVICLDIDFREIEKQIKKRQYIASKDKVLGTGKCIVLDDIRNETAFGINKMREFTNMPPIEGQVFPPLESYVFSINHPIVPGPAENKNASASPSIIRDPQAEKKPQQESTEKRHNKGIRH